MSDQPAVSAAGAPEPSTPPEPQIVSPASTGQPSSQASDAVLDELRQLRAEISDLKKGQQSIKDKRLGKLERKQAEIEQAIALKEQYGGNIGLAALAATVNEEPDSDFTPPPGRSVEPDYEKDYEKVLLDTGTEPTDPDLKEIASRAWTSKQAFLQKLPSELAKARSRKAKQGGESVASVVAEGGGTPPASTTEAKLLADYGTEMRTARGNPSEIRAIKAKFKAKGLPVEQVVLS